MLLMHLLKTFSMFLINKYNSKLLSESVPANLLPVIHVFHIWL